MQTASCREDAGEPAHAAERTDSAFLFDLRIDYSTPPTAHSILAEGRDASATWTRIRRLRGFQNERQTMKSGWHQSDAIRASVACWVKNSHSVL